MIIKGKTNDDICRALKYIGDDRLLCFYLYMDMIECGIDNQGLGLWLSEMNSEIEGVFYRYYDCLHCFSRKTIDINDALNVINEINPKVIVSSEENINAMIDVLDRNRYTYELNHIITVDSFLEENDAYEVCQAKNEDVPSIAKMMMQDVIYSSVYSYSKLCDDLSRRLNDGFGRLFVIRNECDEIVCANATYAETEDLAVIGGLVTSVEARGRGLGGAITANTWNRIRREGKTGLAFLLDGNANTISLHKKMGYRFIGSSARLIMND